MEISKTWSLTNKSQTMMGADQETAMRWCGERGSTPVYWTFSLLPNSDIAPKEKHHRLKYLHSTQNAIIKGPPLSRASLNWACKNCSETSWCLGTEIEAWRPLLDVHWYHNHLAQVNLEKTWSFTLFLSTQYHIIHHNVSNITKDYGLDSVCIHDTTNFHWAL